MNDQVVLVLSGTRCMIAAGPLFAILNIQERLVSQGFRYTDHTIISPEEFNLDCQKGDDGRWRPIVK